MLLLGFIQMFLHPITPTSFSSSFPCGCADFLCEQKHLGMLFGFRLLVAEGSLLSTPLSHGLDSLAHKQDQRRRRFTKSLLCIFLICAIGEMHVVRWCNFYANIFHLSYFVSACSPFGAFFAQNLEPEATKTRATHPGASWYRKIGTISVFLFFFGLVNVECGGESSKLGICSSISPAGQWIFSFVQWSSSPKLQTPLHLKPWRPKLVFFPCTYVIVLPFLNPSTVFAMRSAYGGGASRRLL